MDTEFHYWITGLIAHRAGFSEEDSIVIAYSSEYVDQNDVIYKIKGKSSKKIYSNYISQTMNILRPKSELMLIYPIFHFIPGEPDAKSAQRRDGKMHLLNTTPNNEKANQLMDAAFKSSKDNRLYRIGIATHGYMDTWAHQNFVGWLDYFNNIGLDIKPDIGHANAEHSPDWVSHKWPDNRLRDPDVDNCARFLWASLELFNKYCQYLKVDKNIDNSSNWVNLEGEINGFMGKSFAGYTNRYKKERYEKYHKLIKWLPNFDERFWFNEAIKTQIRGVKDKHDSILSNFTIFKDDYFWRQDIDQEKTDWYKFQESVKDHERYAVDILNPLFKKMGEKLNAD